MSILIEMVARLLHQLLIILTRMLNPIDKEYASLIKELQTRLYNMESARQPYLGDWREITETLAYVDSNTVEYSDATIDARDVFSVGDLVRWKQTGDGDYRYGYIVSASGNEIDIEGGSDYDVANLAITEFAKGLTKNPIGHPILLNYTPNITALQAGSTYSNVDASQFEIAQFFMTGPLVSVRLDVTFGNMAGGTSELSVDFPFDSTFITYERRVISCTDNNNFATGLAKAAVGGSMEVYSNSTTLAGFANTAGGLGFNISIEYVADT